MCQFLFSLLDLQAGLLKARQRGGMSGTWILKMAEDETWDAVIIESNV